MRLTEQEYLQKQKELSDIEISLEETLREQSVAREFGDASENAELEAATKRARFLQQQKYELEEILADVEIVEPDRGPRIQLGNHVSVQKVDKDKKPLEEARSFIIANNGTTYDDAIDTLLNSFSDSENSIRPRVLGMNSPLCKAILNGTSGIYKIKTEQGNVYYNVVKEV